MNFSYGGDRLLYNFITWDCNCATLQRPILVASVARGEGLTLSQVPAPRFLADQPTVRFDDRLITILNYPVADAGGRAAVWVQIVDLLAQDRGQMSASIREAALERLAEWRTSVVERRRLASAVAIAGKELPRDLVAFFASDTSVVAAPILVRAQLNGEDWAAIIPAFPPSSRALVRERRDLPDSAQNALSAFGHSDFALPTAPIENFVEPKGEAVPSLALPIGELVKRIEAYRGRHPGSPSRPHRQAHRVPSFAFESDGAGLISWVEGAPRGALIGMALGEMAEPGGFGVDGQASGAFRRRTAIRDARLLVPGHGEASGEWLISAQPFFDTISGRFEGYRGVARRITATANDMVAPFGEGMRPESIRQLVHELRTPLNAIRGFAEMIEGQFLGAIEPPYRHRANSIVLDSGRLLRVFEDLDISARMAGGEEVSGPASEAELVRIMRTTATHHAALADRSGVRLRIALPEQPAPVLVDDATAVRLLDRLLLCVLAAGGRGETVKMALTTAAFEARIEVSRPAALQGLSTEALLDPARPSAETLAQEEIPLGLAFLLRLMRQMAQRANGRFEIKPQSFVLILPQRSDSGTVSIESI